MAGLIIIYQAIIGFIHPHRIQKLDKGIYIVAFTAIVNFIVGAICIAERPAATTPWPCSASGQHLQSDTYSTIGIIVGLVERSGSRGSSVLRSTGRLHYLCRYHPLYGLPYPAQNRWPVSWMRPISSCSSDMVSYVNAQLAGATTRSISIISV